MKLFYRRFFLFFFYFGLITNSLFANNNLVNNNNSKENISLDNLVENLNEKPKEDIPDLVNKVLKTVVSIESFRVKNVDIKNNDDYFIVNEVNDAIEVGSGFLISEDGYIITNNHIIENADKIFVNYNNVNYQANLIGEDYFQDIALLKIDVKEKLPFLELKANLDIKIGEKVIVIGNPYNLGLSVSTGIISAVNRNIKGSEYTNLIQTDAHINKGNSGGPMFNMNGDVIGVNSLIFSPNNGENIGIGFAIPITNIINTVKEIKEFGYVQRGWLGIVGVEIDKDIFKILNSKRQTGILVKDVIEDSPAYKAGILPSDVIISYNNKHIEDLNQLLYMIRNSSINSSVNILILRNEKYIKLKATIKDLPNNIKYNELDEKIKANSIELMDMYISQIDKNLINKYKLYNGLENKGLYVLDIKHNGIAEQNKIEKGDIVLSINQFRLTNKNDLTTVLNNLKNNKQKEFIMIVRKNGLDKNIVLKLNFNNIDYN